MSKIKLPKANIDIKAEQVRLVDGKGEMIGIISLKEALYTARSSNLDLVEISPKIDIPKDDKSRLIMLSIYVPIEYINDNMFAFAGISNFDSFIQAL